MIESYGSFFETLSPYFKDEEFEAVFAPDAHFADPFQSVKGVEAIIKVFRHMYTTLKNPRFEVLETLGDKDKGYVRWRFHYEQSSFEGVSHVCFDSSGKAISHIDYWDAGANVYEKIPFLSLLIRLVKRRIAR